MHGDPDTTRRRVMGVAHRLLSRLERDRVVDPDAEWAETQPVFYLGDDVEAEKFARSAREPASHRAVPGFKRP